MRDTPTDRDSTFHVVTIIRDFPNEKSRGRPEKQQLRVRMIINTSASCSTLPKVAHGELLLGETSVRRPFCNSIIERIRKTVKRRSEKFT